MSRLDGDDETRGTQTMKDRIVANAGRLQEHMAVTDVVVADVVAEGVVSRSSSSRIGGRRAGTG